MSESHNRLLFIETVGCQMNVLDSELVVAALREQGYELTDRVSDADTVLFNTCSVREHAEHKIYSQLGRLKYSKRKRPDQVIGVFGCMAQKDQELIFQRAPHVDMVVGTGQLAEIPRLVSEARRDRTRALAVSLDRRGGSRDEVASSFESYDPLRDPTMRPSPYQAFVRIMIGCDKFCTYCVVPTTRGPEQSRPPSQIASEVRMLAGQGVREVTLIGQTVNSYSHVEDGRTWRLADLLELIHDTEGIDRIKFVTNFPRDMDTPLLEAVNDLSKVCRYLHVPAQSGSDAVLERMKRGYTVDEYREMIGRINEIVPGCAVSSDFIVGFCGESDQEFEASVRLVEECRFKNSFIFKYSPRSGTKADDRLDDDVPEAQKRERNARLLEVQTAICEEDNALFIGRSVEVLVEGLSKMTLKQQKRQHRGTPHPMPGVELSEESDVDLVSLEPGPVPENAEGSDPLAGPIQLVGRTDCDRIVVFNGNPRLAGSLASISVEDCTATTLIGRIMTREIQHAPMIELPVL
jgi:tRNA-2-methylthio-N6-dimethylallyladenosine synthase